VTDSLVGDLTSNPYAPPAEPSALRDDQYVISLDHYTHIMTHNEFGRKTKQQVLVAGLLSLASAVLLLLLKQHWMAYLFPTLLGLLLLKARFTNNVPQIKKIYEHLKLADKVMSFQVKDHGILIHEGRSYAFSPVEEIDRIDIIQDVAIIVRNNVGMQGIHLRTDAIRSIIMKFKHDNAL
jgi:hypothetical protein